MVVRIEGGERGEENRGEKGEDGVDNGERERWEREAGRGKEWVEVERRRGWESFVMGKRKLRGGEGR